jgi:hypothetical protein
MSVTVRPVLATPENEHLFRKMLRDNPVGGDILVSMEREPDALHAAGITGDRHDLLMGVRDDDGDVVVIGGRYELDLFINGEPQKTGYLGELRSAGGFGFRRKYLLMCYREMRRCHESGDVPYYLTTIIADNAPARRLLEANLKGMPVYEPRGNIVTLTIPARAGARARPRLVVESGRKEDLGALAAALLERGRDYQFMPAWSHDVLRSPTRCRGLSADDFLLIRADGGLRASLALWDQRGFKQSIIRGYAGPLARWRPLYNLVAPALRRPVLPPAGSRLESAYLSHLNVDPDDVEGITALVASACRAAVARGLDYVMLGLAEAHPLYETIRATFTTHDYVSVVYVVYWEDGEQAATAIDGRLLHPEVAIL